MTPRMLAATLFLTLLSGSGGFLASLTPLPLPYMLGALFASGLVAMFQAHRLPDGYSFPTPVRAVFMALIGVMVGSQVTGDVLRQLPGLVPSIVALTLFTAAAHAMNYQIYRRIGGYDRPTAFFSGTPGGLLESLAMGEKSGADLQALTMLQFMRIIFVISLLPLGLSIWYGVPLGSASGASITKEAVGLEAIPLALTVGIAGFILGRALRLPAGQLTGPMLAAAIVTGSGLAPLPLPQWLINLAQVVIGASLGLRFTGLRGSAMLRASWLSLLSVLAMLALGLALALVVAQMVALPFDIFLISYAPGGVTEMALVALSLNANPALVTLHHVYRIFLTVIGMGLAARWMGLRDPKP